MTDYEAYVRIEELQEHITKLQEEIKRLHEEIDGLLHYCEKLEQGNA